MVGGGVLFWLLSHEIQKKVINYDQNKFLIPMLTHMKRDKEHDLHHPHLLAACCVSEVAEIIKKTCFLPKELPSLWRQRN